MRTILLSMLALFLGTHDVSSNDFSGAVFNPDQYSLPNSPSRNCSGGELVVHHDYTFEYAYCWSGEGCMQPYYGALAEAFALGPGHLFCGAFWMTSSGYFPERPSDVYVWEGGVLGPPGSVLALLPESWFIVNFWPEVYQTDLEINIEVSSDFTIGYWAYFDFGDYCDYFCAADLDGPGGHPWTNIAPGLQWPSGWQDPSIVWGPIRSLGIGAYFEPAPTPVESRTWGAIKAMFR